MVQRRRSRAVDWHSTGDAWAEAQIGPHLGRDDGRDSRETPDGHQKGHPKATRGHHKGHQRARAFGALEGGKGWGSGGNDPCLAAQVA